ncbi:putative nuclease HARBI1 [Mya arenaria]|uniref:putative nuclease HARBI1 n=1 Tax=Mya arenaria TaxID=6604 RepID=UPI0022E90FAF|nr:putative nuclease HARBI1 [Mya arenaria]
MVWVMSKGNCPWRETAVSWLISYSKSHGDKITYKIHPPSCMQKKAVFDFYKKEMTGQETVSYPLHSPLEAICIKCRHPEGVMDGYLLGDSGYACRRYLLTMYLNTRSPPQERYNRALVKTRVIIEQTYGVLKRRFPCLSYGLRVQPQRCCQIILTCSFLHNFDLDNGYIFDRLDVFDVDQPDHDFQIQNPGNGLLFRDVFAQTFFS